jgi:hypothetical protein
MNIGIDTEINFHYFAAMLGRLSINAGGKGSWSVRLLPVILALIVLGSQFGAPRPQRCHGSKPLGKAKQAKPLGPEPGFGGGLGQVIACVVDGRCVTSSHSRSSLSGRDPLTIAVIVLLIDAALARGDGQIWPPEPRSDDTDTN